MERLIARSRGIRSPPRARIAQALAQRRLEAGRLRVEHRWKHASILASGWKHGVPVTVHPGMGYDIIANHPILTARCSGAAATRFKLFGGSLEKAENGVVLSVGSAIMGPQVFEKSMSCVNNLRLHAGRACSRATRSTWWTCRRRRLGPDPGRAAEDERGV